QIHHLLERERQAPRDPGLGPARDRNASRRRQRHPYQASGLASVESAPDRLEQRAFLDEPLAGGNERRNHHPSRRHRRGEEAQAPLATRVAAWRRRSMGSSWPVPRGLRTEFRSLSKTFSTPRD